MEKYVFLGQFYFGSSWCFCYRWLEDDIYHVSFVPITLVPTESIICDFEVFYNF